MKIVLTLCIRLKYLPDSNRQRQMISKFLDRLD